MSTWSPSPARMPGMAADGNTSVTMRSMPTISSTIRAASPRQPLHFNQFGLTVGGPIIKDKLFFFLSLQGDRFKSQMPSRKRSFRNRQAWRDAVINADAESASRAPCGKFNSTAALLYQQLSAPANERGQSHWSYSGQLHAAAITRRCFALTPARWTAQWLRRTDYSAAPETGLHFWCHASR